MVYSQKPIHEPDFIIIHVKIYYYRYQYYKEFQADKLVFWQKIYRTHVPEHIRDYLYLTKNIFLKAAFSVKTLDRVLIDPNLRKMKRRLISFKGKYSNKRCFIMGNGPSLNQMNLNLLQNEYVWGSNRIYLLFNRINWRPKFFIAVDRRVVPDNASELDQLSQDLPNTFFFYPRKYRLENILSSRENVYWYDEVELDEKHLPDGAFSLDASRRVYRVNTVTVAALQMAVYLGFNPIYLIGCDTNYSIPSTVEFEDDEKRLIISREDDDPNHFAANYFGKDKKWHDPKVEKMILHYEQAKQVCENTGVQVFNATIGGKLEVFDRVDYYALFQPAQE